jgi:hypothetical protein
MKKTFYAAIIGGLSIIALIFACSKNNDAPVSTSSNKLQFEEIGIAHNKAVKYILEHTDPDAPLDVRGAGIQPLLKEVLPEAYKAWEAAGSPEDNDFTRMIIDNSKSPDYKGYINSLKLSPELTDALSRIVNVVYKNYDLPILESKLYNLEVEAKLKLQPKDLVVLLSATSVAKYSARLWYSKERGGEDAYNQYFLVRRTKPLTSTTKLLTRDVECNGQDTLPVYARDPRCSDFLWGELIVADAEATVVAAISACATTGGAAAIPNPLTGLPPASYAAVIGGVVGSARNAYYQTHYYRK